MKLSVSAYRAHASAHKKILSSGYHSQLNYGSTGAAASSSSGGYALESNEIITPFAKEMNRQECNSDTDVVSPTGTSSSGQDHMEAVVSSSKHRKNKNKNNDGDNHSNAHSSDSKSPRERKSRIGDGASDPDSDWNRSNQRWMKLRTTVQISSAIQKKPPLKREDSFLKRFSTRQIPETQETVEDTGSESASGDVDKVVKRRRRYLQKRRSVVNPDENFYFYWLMMLTVCVLYNLWTLIVRQSFPELQQAVPKFWFICDMLTDVAFIFDIIVQLRTGYLEQGLMVYDDKKLASHYVHSRAFIFDMVTLIPLDLLQLKMGTQPLLRFTRFFKVYRSVKFYYIVESRTVWPNLWRVVNLIHILLILAHWFGCFYYLLSEAEGFQGDWVYPYRPGDYATLTRKYLGSLYWSTLTLTTIGDLPTPETNAEYVFTIVSYLIGVFIFATIVGQVGNVITNRNANRLEFERLLDGAKTYMRHHKVPGGMKRRVLRWYDYSWSRGRIQGGGDINTALGLLPDKLKTELALHVNLSVLKKVTIFQECQPEFLHDLVLKMKAYIFTPGDSICRKGEVAREMFIIADGILEVLSETGKVLTTMKAGDFFGEIGILNLDGLNKRTADVRSVGYSELFSLSREDVLAAMKDYPDAQEILQTLGRKRLMEVRCVNKRHAKAQSDKEAAALQKLQSHAHGLVQGPGHGHVNQSDSSENSASKKMVDKLKNDVKGFRNALKKPRTTRRSDESLEMQPLHNISPKSGGKSMLKRMSRVRSDDKDETAEEKEELHDKTPSPIGAGLPLLQRLRLLKEKQDREERAVKSTPPQKSPPHSHVTCTLSPQESIQEEPEREINEGFPLIQRLQHLKLKNDALAIEAKAAVTSPEAISHKMDTISFVNNNKSNNHHGGITGTPSLTVAQIKPMMKVSFKQRIQQLQSNAITTMPAKVKCSKSGDATICGTVLKKDPPRTLPLAKYGTGSATTTIDDSVSAHKAHKPISTISNKIVKPSIITTTSSVISETDTPIKPWSKLKLATLISSSYSSLTNCSPDDIDIDTPTPLKNFSTGSIPHSSTMTAEEYDSAARTGIALQRASLPSSRSSYGASANSSPNGGDTPVSNSSNNAVRLGHGTKFYQSVFDLSPEYSGLPFVKRLKILNERQKLAELEKALQTRSFSLDSSKTPNSHSLPISESLYRCYSDTSGIYSQFMSAYESSSTTSTNTSTSADSNSRRHHATTSTTPPPQLESVVVMQHDYSPLSPESNETLERRKLKSILKKLHCKSREQTDALPLRPQQDDDDCSRYAPAPGHGRGLPREPTLEGPPAHVSAKVCANNAGAYAYEESCFAAFSGTQAIGDVQTDAIQAASVVASSSSSSSSTPVNSTKENFEYASASDAAAAATIKATKLECSKRSLPIKKLTISPMHSITNPLTDQNQNSSNRQDAQLEGFAEEPEYVNQILCGINSVIKRHMSEMHLQFESRFSNMACEVKRRDALIAHLQMKLRNMELKSASTRRKHNREKLSQASDDAEPKSEGNSSSSSSGSSAELLFMRGDSLDTVFTSSPPIQSEHSSTSPSTSRKLLDCSAAYNPYHKYPNFSTHGNGESASSKPWSESQAAMMISDVTGNLTRLSDSVILDIGESSSSSSSSSKLNVAADDDFGEDDVEEQQETEAEADEAKNALNEEDIPSVHHNDWEVRMLAAEMEKQERKRGHSLSGNMTDLKHCGTFLRRRRKFSDTETECSETDADEMAAAAAPTRPRASSLDQFNLRYGIGSGIFKAMSIDRDKDKL